MLRSQVIKPAAMNMKKTGTATTNTTATDVLINGGGLAGLSLAHQLRRRCPSLDITVLESKRFPRPLAIPKVGESTVEIGAHYLRKSVGIGAHLQQQHLPKFGLRCFFGETSNDLSQQDELGASQSFGVPTYQIDRGALENHLFDCARERGIDVVDAATTKAIGIEGSLKNVKVSGDDGERTFTAPWLVDASGRQAMLKNKLQLTKACGHKGNALWFRIDRKITIDSWSENPAWRARCNKDFQGRRWLSTNHLMGSGYWVWIIPLHSGVTSIGIVMDDCVWQQADFTTYTGMLAWLMRNQRRCADAISGAKVLDYVCVRDYAYNCRQTFSAEGWALSGEASVFADPLYSPGSDFIAIGNTFITELIHTHASGKNIQLNSAISQKLFDSFFQSTLSLYQGQYGGFGDRKMMGLKLLWDYAYYWGVLCLLFFQNTIADLDFLRRHSQLLIQVQNDNINIQALFRQRAKRRIVLPNQGVFMDQYQIPCLREFNNALKTAPSNDHSEQLKTNAATLARLSTHVQYLLEDRKHAPASTDETDLLGNYRQSLLA